MEAELAREELVSSRARQIGFLEFQGDRVLATVGLETDLSSGSGWGYPECSTVKGGIG